MNSSLSLCPSKFKRAMGPRAVRTEKEFLEEVKKEQLKIGIRRRIIRSLPYNSKLAEDEVLLGLRVQSEGSKTVLIRMACRAQHQVLQRLVNPTFVDSNGDNAFDYLDFYFRGIKSFNQCGI